MLAKGLKIWRKSFDESLLRINIKNNYQNMSYVSEGMHHRVYKWVNNDVSFAVYQAKHRFYDETDIDLWVRALDCLADLQHAWIPIINYFTVDGDLFIAQPYLESELSFIREYELKAEEHSFRELLKSHKLELNDILQFRSSEIWGIQIHDWSDLRIMGSSNG